MIAVSQEVEFDTNILSVQVPAELRHRISTGVRFFDDILGGEGLTPSQVVMLTGTPGAGKTTLLAMVADGVTAGGNLCFYNTAEESKYQVKMMAERLKLRTGFVIGQHMELPAVLADAEKLRAKYPGRRLVLVIDSLQTISDGSFSTGRITCATAPKNMISLVNYAKTNLVSVVAIGHVNKDGKASGSNQMKHVADTKLHISVLESPKDEDLKQFKGCRLLEVEKNRFSLSGKVSFLRMGDGGNLIQVGEGTRF